MRYIYKKHEEEHYHQVYLNWFKAEKYQVDDIFVFVKNNSKTLFYLRHEKTNSRPLLLHKSCFVLLPPIDKQLEDYM